MSKKHHLWTLLIMLMGWSHAATRIWAISSPKSKYSTTQAYITDNFQGSIEVVNHWLTNAHTTGGIAVGYYLHKYYHKPLTEAERLRTIVSIYNPATKTWSTGHSERDSTREGEASLVLEVGVQFPGQVQWKPQSGNKAYVVEKFLHVPICLKWIRPISFWNFDIFSSLSAGCMIRYLRNSVYVPDLSDFNLHTNPKTPRQKVDVKTLPHMPFFYYDILLEWSCLFPMGLYIGLVCSLSLDSFMAHANIKLSPDEGQLDGASLRWHRGSEVGHVFAWKVGFDFCRLLKYFNNL